MLCAARRTFASSPVLTVLQQSRNSFRLWSRFIQGICPGEIPALYTAVSQFLRLQDICKQALISPMLYCIGSPGVSLDLDQSTIPQHQISVQPKENVHFRTKVQRKLGETPQAGMQASGDWGHPWPRHPGCR
jgi:hypothetical protein